MMENGLHQFYESFAAYKQKLFERTLEQQEDDDATIEQSKSLMLFLSSAWSIAIIIFIVEIIFSKLKTFITRIISKMYMYGWE